MLWILSTCQCIQFYSIFFNSRKWEICILLIKKQEQCERNACQAGIVACGWTYKSEIKLVLLKNTARRYWYYLNIVFLHISNEIKYFLSLVWEYNYIPVVGTLVKIKYYTCRCSHCSIIHARGKILQKTFIRVEYLINN